MVARDRMRGRVGAVQNRLARRADTAIGRLVLEWFRRYFEASRNSGAAATLSLILSVTPLLLAATALFHATGRDTNAFAQRLIDHQHLTGPTARLVREMFGSVAQNARAAAVVAVVGFWFCGIAVGQIYQDFYARAWRVQVRSLSDQVRYTIWFFALSGAVGLFVVFAASVRNLGWGLFVPVWLVGSVAFWLWTPRFLLHRTIGLRALLPGAILASLVIGGLTAASRFFLGRNLNGSSRYFGSFGVALALLAWAYTLTTISLVCAAFSPVWAEQRERAREQTRRAPPR